jgi:hypothetical protein
MGEHDAADELAIERMAALEGSLKKAHQFGRPLRIGQLGDSRDQEERAEVDSQEDEKQAGHAGRAALLYEAHCSHE